MASEPDGRMDVLFETRFSFLGTSGWREQTTTTAETLYEPERMRQRFELFEKLTLPSLRDQSDPDFRHYVLSGRDMPEAQKKTLREMCHDMLGDRADVQFRKPGPVAQFVTRYTRRTYRKSPRLAQVVLDDDDALSTDYVQVLRAEAEAARAYEHDGLDFLYLTFPRGVTLRFNEDGPPDVFDRNVVNTNLGLALVGPGDTKRNPFAVAHKMVYRRHPVRVIQTRRPFYVRSLHDYNDSRRQKQVKPFNAKKIAEAAQYLPCLNNFFGDALKVAA
ncbi:MAG: glycosyltransferase [Pseudomonadota bacterium]